MADQGATRPHRYERNSISRVDTSASATVDFDELRDIPGARVFTAQNGLELSDGATGQTIAIPRRAATHSRSIANSDTLKENSHTAIWPRSATSLSIVSPWDSGPSLKMSFPSRVRCRGCKTYQWQVTKTTHPPVYS